MDSIKLLTVILTIILGIMLMLLFILAIVYISSKAKKNQTIKVKDPATADSNSKTKKYKEYRKESIMNFLEFDTVVDNMISQKDGMRYVMVVECQGINYDLMSQAEKNAVEEGFIQFLNTLRYPVQIYTQTRTINLESSIQKYKEKIKETQYELEKQQMRYEEMIKSGNYSEEELKKVYFELTKQRNLYEYGKDIIYNTQKMSSNKNVLNQKYYVIIPYFIEELGDNQYDKQEQRNIAFSELYTRAQSIIRTLLSCSINSRVMTSNELVELLYIAYNRDESEIYGIEKALKAGYDELYSTAPDVVDKQMRELDRQINQEALEKAKYAIKQVKSEKRRNLEEKKENKEELIDELAKIMIQENADAIGKDLAKKAIEKIDKKEGGTKDNVKQEKTKRTRKTKTAE